MEKNLITIYSFEVLPPIQLADVAAPMQRQVVSPMGIADCFNALEGEYGVGRVKITDYAFMAFLPSSREQRERR